jgi:hypothetical protein
LKVFQYGLVCLCVVAAVSAQSSKPSTTAKPTLKQRPASSAAEAPASDVSGNAANIPADAPVVTVQGLCEKPPNSTATPSDCKTVITRAEFERITNAVQPNMPAPAKKQFVSRYVVVLALAEKAHELGLDQGPDFDEQMNISRLQVAARLAGEHMQKEAGQVSESEIDEYYRAHAGDFKTASFDRLYVPKQKQTEAAAAGQKPDDPNAENKRESSEPAMKEEADKLRARAVGGEDFAKLQQEAYDLAEYKMKASNTRVDNVRKNSIPPADAAIFDLKKGEVSQVFTEPTGFMIYKIEDLQQLPQTAVREEIVRTLQAEKTKQAFEALQNSVKPALNESYFATPAPPSLKKPGESPAVEQPAPGKK